MSDPEQEWYERLHATWTTPEHVVDRAVTDATGSPPVDRSRIIAGEGNEVWSIATADGDRVIVRISHHDTFAREHWAVRLLGQRGIPVPDVLFLDDAVEVGDGQVAIWVHRYIDGRPLDSVGAGHELDHLSTRAGEVLGRIHDASIVGGPLDGPHALRSDDALRWGDEAAEAACRFGVAEADLHTAATLLAAMDRPDRCDRLLHGDWLREHVLVRGGEVVGVIDLNPLGGDAAYDLAFWDFFTPLGTPPSAALIEGYRRSAPVDDALLVRVHAYRIAHSMRTIAYYAGEGRDRWARHCAGRFMEALEQLRRAQ